MIDKEILSQMYDCYFIEEVKPTQEYFYLNQLIEEQIKKISEELCESKKREIEDIRNKIMEAEGVMNRTNFIQGYIIGSKMMIEILDINKNEE